MDNYIEIKDNLRLRRDTIKAWLKTTEERDFRFNGVESTQFLEFSKELVDIEAKWELLNGLK